MSKKSKRGGARKGAGAKKKEPTKVIHVPLSKLPAILKALGKASDVSGSVCDHPYEFITQDEKGLLCERCSTRLSD